MGPGPGRQEPLGGGSDGDGGIVAFVPPSPCRPSKLESLPPEYADLETGSQTFLFLCSSRGGSPPRKGEP